MRLILQKPELEFSWGTNIGRRSIKCRQCDRGTSFQIESDWGMDLERTSSIGEQLNLSASFISLYLYASYMEVDKLDKVKKTQRLLTLSLYVSLSFDHHFLRGRSGPVDNANEFNELGQWPYGFVGSTGLISHRLFYCVNG